MKKKYIRKQLRFSEEDYKRLELDYTDFSNFARTSMLIAKIEDEIKKETQIEKLKYLKKELLEAKYNLEKIRTDAIIKKQKQEQTEKLKYLKKELLEDN